MLKCPAILFDIAYLLLKSLHSHGSVGAIGHASIRGLCRTMATSSLVRDLPQSIGRTRSALFSRGRIRDGISYGLSTVRILRILRDDFIITSIGEERRPLAGQRAFLRPASLVNRTATRRAITTSGIMPNSGISSAISTCTAVLLVRPPRSLTSRVTSYVP